MKIVHTCKTRPTGEACTATKPESPEVKIVNGGETTEEIRCEPLRSATVDIDEVQSERFYNLPIGRPVKATIMDVLFTGYVIERTVSGGDLTTYSIKIQPDRFYKYGEEVTDKWI